MPLRLKLPHFHKHYMIASGDMGKDSIPATLHECSCGNKYTRIYVNGYYYFPGDKLDEKDRIDYD